MNSNEIRQQTVMKTYGVSNVSQLEDIQVKRRASFDAKHVMLLYQPLTADHTLHANDLQLYKLNTDVAELWLDEYHPLKHSRGTVLALGLVKDDKIYCVMTFKKSRNSNYVAELSRMWTLPSYNITDGYSQLSQEASNFGIYNVVAYVNLSFENTLDYESIGMKYVRSIQRTKWWVRGEDMMSDASRRQKKITTQDMMSRGYESVYDCGQAVYVYD